MKKILRIGLFVIGIALVIVYVRIASAKNTFETCTIYDVDDVNSTNFKKHDSVLVSASFLYTSDALKTLLQGENFRNAWKAKVKLPIVFLDTLYGGMQILKEGGGKQTQSLRLQSVDNQITYSLRSINKNPQKLIPKFAQTLGLENIIIDGISSQHPYASPVVARLSDAVGVPHTHPMPVFVPKQDHLGTYNETYGNRMYMLEYETEGKTNWTRYENVLELLDTEDLQELKMQLRNRLTIDKPSLVRARLFDLLIGDWDRHTKQWGWAITKQDSSYIAYPIPGDRDNAFFTTSGIIPTIITNKNVVKEVRPFQEDIDYMEGLVYDFDVYFLQNTPEQIFIQETTFLQQQLTDETIENALRYWNDELYDLYAEEITKKLKARRENLLDFAKEFKRVLDSKPLLDHPLKGSERDDVDQNLLQCFEC